jgi:hypothetical protein
VDLDLPGSVRFDPARPRRGAFELAKRMREERPALFVVIFSAHVSPAIVNYAQLIDVDFLSKVEAGENLRALAGRIERVQAAEKRLRPSWCGSPSSTG